MPIITNRTNMGGNCRTHLPSTAAIDKYCSKNESRLRKLGRIEKINVKV
jgi:hypothetical protein